MSGKRLLEEVAESARAAGWQAPDGIDHYEYIRQALRGMEAIRLALEGDRERNWLRWAYASELEDLRRRRLVGSERIEPWPLPDLGRVRIATIARVAPARWGAEVALLAVRVRKRGQADKFLKAICRIQAACVRHGVDPSGASGRASVRARRDGRALDLFLLSRVTEIEEELENSGLWTTLTVEPAEHERARPGDASAARAWDDITPEEEGWDG